MSRPARQPWTRCHTQATERIWIKTRSSAGRGLLFYEALMGVERSLDYLRVKAPGRRAVKCQTSALLTSQVRRQRIRVCRCEVMRLFFFSVPFFRPTDGGDALVNRRLHPKFPWNGVLPLFKRTSGEHPEAASSLFTHLNLC